MRIPMLGGGAAAALLVAVACDSPAEDAVTPVPESPDLMLADAAVRHLADLDLLVFEQTVAGTAGATEPPIPGEAAEVADQSWKAVAERGRFDGAAVLAYVFPTTLKPTDVGFGDVDGTLALVATAHPLFDDTPLWDESGDGLYANDGALYHAHWVVLVPDDRVPGGLAVKETTDERVDVLPPTNPGMPLYLDSPGFSVLLENNRLRLVVPRARAGGTSGFRFDAVTAYLEVNTSDADRPLLGVYKVYDTLSEGMTLPYEVTKVE